MSTEGEQAGKKTGEVLERVAWVTVVDVRNVQQLALGCDIKEVLDYARGRTHV